MFLCFIELEVTAAIKAEEKKALQRAKTPIVGDLNTLKLSLPDLSTKPESKKKRKKKKTLNLQVENKFKTKSKKSYKG